jgi:penicillin-binding protein 1A
MANTTARRLLNGTVRLTLIALLIGGVVGARWVQTEVLNGLPSDLDGLRGWRPPGACRILAADGSEVHRFYDERRFWVPLAELPPHLPRSVLVAEDRSFLEHRGVDLRGIARAFRANVEAGRAVQGGSTITQQVVKKLLVGQDRTLRRKLREAVLAYRLERTLAKEEILELYLNYVALGAGNNGVEAAAQDYFGCSARDLDPGQSALLAGLIPAPSRYSPRRDPDLAAERRAQVLQARVALGELTEEAIEPWLRAPVLQPSPPPEPLAADYATAVVHQIDLLIGRAEATREGLDVHTALDLDLQRAAHRAVRRAAEGVRDRQGLRGPRRHLDETDAFLARAPGLRRAMGHPLPPAEGECFEAVVAVGKREPALHAGPFVFELPRREWKQVVAAEAANRGRRQLGKTVAAGDVLSVCMGEGGTLRLDSRPWAEGAAVVIENATGRVLALVGGLNPTQGGYVRATQARRQPGSTFKTFVYAAALQDGLSPADRVWPPPAVEEGEEPPDPGPTLRRALASSINEAAVHLYRRRAPGAVRDVAVALGVRTPLRDDPSVALGSSEVTPLDMASAYGALARMGVPIEPTFIDRLVDVDGGVLARAGGGVGSGEAVLPGAPGPRALDGGVARSVVGMLEAVISEGTGRAARAPGLARAGKTGTTDDHVDAWFVGMTPSHTVAVWIGVDDRMPLGWGEYGGRAALPAWVEIVEALGASGDGSFGPAPGAVKVPVRGTWMWVPRDGVPSFVMKTPKPGDAPLAPWGMSERPSLGK